MTLISRFLCRLFLTLGLLAVPAARAEAPFIIVASTSSTQNSGLFDHILPLFHAESGIDVRVLAVGTGQAIRLARNGDADVLLVHHKPSEERFVADGFGVRRFDVMYNEFVLVGPAGDPAHVAAMSRAAAAFARIAEAEAPFVSRGDDSGTHKRELAIWREAGVDVATNSPSWYREAGSGMGATLNTAAAMAAYTLADSGTWLNFNNRLDLAILLRGDPALFNPYGVILVNKDRHPHVKSALGQRFIDWLISPAGQAAIDAFTIDGERAFTANAQADSVLPSAETSELPAMYEFKYHRPATLAQAAEIHGSAADAQYLAGGQSLLPSLKFRLSRPSDVIDLSSVPDLDFITAEDNALLIGAATPHADVAASEAVATAIPALAELAGLIGDPQVRNCGTLGGAIANNDPAADYPAAVLGLGATVITTGREISADDFFTDMFETALEEGEIITAVRFPIAAKAGYAKFPNPASRYAIAGVFAAQTAAGVRIAVTGAGPCVFRASDMEAALGQALSGSVELPALPPDGLNSDMHASAEYRAHLVAVMAGRAIEAAIG